MKSYNHLWEQFVSEENIRLAIINSSKRKRKRKLVKDIYENPDKWIPTIKQYAENFKNCNHAPVEIYDGITRKKRKIIVPQYKEQIIHHMIINVLEPIFRHGMYEHSYGSIPGRGSHKAKKIVEKWIKHDTKNVKYCLKMDIRKFFDSVPHDILKNKLALIIHDEKFLAILNELIDVTDKGIPLGFYTSQWFANWHLQELDHYIKEDLQAVYYMRYMDDMIIFGSNKRILHKIRNAISVYLNQKLGVELKDNWQVFRFDYVKMKNHKEIHYGRMLDYMGFKFYRNKTTLRKSIMLKATRKAKQMSKQWKVTIHSIRQMLSYMGWITCTNTYNMYKKWIKPYVNLRNCKKRISNYDKRKNKEVQQHECKLCQIPVFC